MKRFLDWLWNTRPIDVEEIQRLERIKYRDMLEQSIRDDQARNEASLALRSHLRIKGHRARKSA